MDTNKRVSEHFTEKELACSHCGMLNLHPGFIDKLEAVRIELNEPMHITSGCRCAVHNKAVGGVPSSTHICDELPYKAQGQKGTLGVDIAATDGGYRGRLFSILWRHGFTIGWNAKKNFLHADQRVMVGLQQTSFDY